MSNLRILMNGIIAGNPAFVLLLGTCPTLGTTSSVINGVGMGLTMMLVLIYSNIVVSALRNVIPDLVRTPGYIVMIATSVTVVQICMEMLIPALYASLELFTPLVVVDYIVLGCAETFVTKNGVAPSAFDGISIELGFTMVLTLLGTYCEFLGIDKLFNVASVSEEYGSLIFALALGVFITLGYLVAIVDELCKA